MGLRYMGVEIVCVNPMNGFLWISFGNLCIQQAYILSFVICGWKKLMISLFNNSETLVQILLKFSSR